MSTHYIVAQLASHLASLPAGPLIVAVSGGPDSLALLYALCESGIAADVHVYHLDHGLRGAQSAADADMVRQCAVALGLPHRIDKADIAAEAPQYHNINESARVVRYRRIAQYAQQINAVSVLVAHTRDDQAETVMMRLLRGSGPTGLTAMRSCLAWSQWAPADIAGRATLQRPLLDCDRADIIDYCHQRNLTPRHDPSNDKLSNQRIRMRQQILPTLRREQPQLNAILRRTALLCGDDADFIAQQLTLAWPTFAQHTPDAVTFERTAFRNLHVAIQRAAIRQAILLLHNSLRGWSLDHIEAVRTAFHHELPIPQLPHHTTVRRTQTHITIMPQQALPSAPFLSESTIIHVPNNIDCTHGWWIHATPDIAQPTRNRWHVFLDPTPQYIVRTRINGESMGIGHNQHRRLQDIFVDAHIPASQRAHWPIIATHTHVVWIPGVRVDPAFVAQPNTSAIHLSLIQSAEDDNLGYD